MTVNTLLSRNLASFNDLLDLFQDYLATIEGPLTKATHMIGEEFDYHEGPIFSHIVGVLDDAQRLGDALRQLRQAHVQTEQVTFALPRKEAESICRATEELPYILHSAASAFELLHVGASLEYFATDDRGPMAVMELAGRAMRSAAETEGEAVTRLVSLIRRETAQAPEKEVF